MDPFKYELTFNPELIHKAVYLENVRALRSTGLEKVTLPAGSYLVLNVPNPKELIVLNVDRKHYIIFASQFTNEAIAELAPGDLPPRLEVLDFPRKG